MAERRDHFMPISLLQNQFEVLEAPSAEENALIVDVAPPVERVAQTIIAELNLKARAQP